jgi:hypothetical protein
LWRRSLSDRKKHNNINTALWRRSLSDRKKHNNINTALWRRRLSDRKKHNINTALWRRSLSDRKKHNNINTGLWRRRLSDRKKHNNINTALWRRRLSDRKKHNNINTALWRRRLSDRKKHKEGEEEKEKEKGTAKDSKRKTNMGNCLPLASILRKTLTTSLGLGIEVGTSGNTSSDSLSPVLRRKQTISFTQMYTLGPELGRGQFGTTYLCIEKASGARFACKCIEKSKLVSREDVEDVRREVHILHHLSGNPNIVSIIGSYEDSRYVYLVMDLCEGGELFDRITKRGYYSEREAANTIKVIISVVETCHSHGVMHRDLKPENFLFSQNTDDSPLKAIDFGLSVFFKPGTLNSLPM